MAIYAVGDLQGCYKPLREGLEKLNFSPSQDTLYCVGDLINRGPESGEVVRYLMDLGDSVKAVLGNHDISFLVAAEGIKDTIEPDVRAQILDAPDAAEIVHWFRHLPLAIYDEALDILLIHAGLYPEWSVAQALKLTARIEKKLQHPEHEKYHKFLSNIFGDSPTRWSTDYKKKAQNRFIVNACTRMRFLSSRRELDFDCKVAPHNNLNPSIFPWLTFNNPHLGDTRVVFGHWAALGLYMHRPYYGLDTGYVWGNTLTFVRLDTEEITLALQVSAEPSIV